MTEPNILSIPTSTFSFFLAPCLDSSDFLALRAASKDFYSLIHNDAEDHIWKDALIRDFSFQDVKSSSEEDNLDATLVDQYLQTLRLSEEHKRLQMTDEKKSLSVFGYSASDGVFTASSFFESWKHWKKASRRYYHVWTERKRNQPALSKNINAPYFLRAAKIWSQIENWCDDPESGDVGDNIKLSLNPGLHYCDTILNSFCANADDVVEETQSYEAVFAFYGGQKTQTFADSKLYGLLGGYSAYDARSCTFLYDASSIKTRHDLTTIPIAGTNHGYKVFHLSPQDGHVYLSLQGLGSHIFVPAINAGEYLFERKSFEDLHPKYDALLIWLKEFSDRLYKKHIGLGKIWDEQKNDAIVQYPTLTANTTINYPNGIKLASRAVSRGIEVVASAILAPEIRAFIYCFRIRLLERGHIDYVSREERGFKTCQLKSRHWIIHNYERKSTERVDGDGVVGLHPLLIEGGFRNDQIDWNGSSIAEGDFDNGPFRYQSCTQPPAQGHFEGHIIFVPGSLQQPEGEPFQVRVAPFALDKYSNFTF